MLISELLDHLPEKVHKGDFVLNLSAGVTDENAEKTLKDYVVTPQLADGLENALTFIKSAVEGKTSKAAYLHGSFGSGKSHFMAVLNLLLRGHKRTRHHEDLQPVLQRQAWVEGKKFLLVPYHLIGARNLESAILGGYVEHVRIHHPKAPLPGVYVAEDIFANANDLRRKLGDEKFFATLNGATDAEWGEMESGWDAKSFGAATAALPGSDPRTELVGALIQNVFTSYKGVAAAGKEEAFVPLDQGLSILSRHAKALGYDALILFLDELILWMASHAADVDFLHREGQKLAKLVESQTADRPVPVVSFVARQRDLRELIGDTVTGARHVNFSDALKHWEGRFHVITLEDRNLPAITEKRLLKPKSAAARDEFDRAFRDTIKMRPQARETLTGDADEKMFRQVYPFSPALVETLVAVSAALQRERTALKIMLQMLVDRRNTLQLGELIPVGDLWDAVTQGEEAFSDVLRKRFLDAKKLYRDRLRPVLEDEYRQSGAGRNTPHTATGDQPPVALADDRIIKTLLLAALVPEVPALKNLTPDRLAALNHGSIKSLIPGQEKQVVLGKLRSWVARVGEIRLSDESANPVVSIQVVGVDTEGIIEKARHFDSAGNQQRYVRDLVMDALELKEPNALFHGYEFVWRGTARDVDVSFANIREAAESMFEGPAGGWRVLIDWPFDEQGHDRTDDISRIQKLIASGRDRRTLLWNPLFFSRKVRNELGRLVILTQLVKEEMFKQYAGHLSLQDQATAKDILESNRNALKTSVKSAVEAAYGVRPAGEGQLDAAHDGQETRFWSLSPLLTPQAPVGATLADALEHLAGQALAAEFPAHPNFDPDGRKKEVRPADLNKVWEIVQQAQQDPDQRAPVAGGPLRSLVRQVVEPLRLGVVTESHFVLSDEWRAHFEKSRSAAGLDVPTVEHVRGWTDLPQKRGLPEVVGNLLVLTYALQTNRRFYLDGGPESPALEKLRPNMQLRPEPLPSAAEWTKALERAEGLFGIKLPSAMLTGSNVALLDKEVREKLAIVASAVPKLSPRLIAAAGRLQVTEEACRSWPRSQSAAQAEKLVKALQAAQGPKALAQGLAKASLDGPLLTLSKSIASAPDVAGRLDSIRWTPIDGMAGLSDPRARNILDDLVTVLRDDERDTPLVAAVAEAEGRADRLLAELAKRPDPVIIEPKTPPPEKGYRRVSGPTAETLDAAEFERRAGELAADLRVGVGRRIRITWEIEEKDR